MIIAIIKYPCTTTTSLRRRENMVGVNMVGVNMVVHDASRECFKGTMLEPCLLKPCFHAASTSQGIHFLRRSKNIDEYVYIYIYIYMCTYIYIYIYIYVYVLKIMKVAGHFGGPLRGRPRAPRRREFSRRGKRASGIRILVWGLYSTLSPTIVSDENSVF